MRESEKIDVLLVEDEYGDAEIHIAPRHWVWVYAHPARDAIEAALEGIRSEIPHHRLTDVALNDQVATITAGENEALYRITIPRERPIQ